MNVKMKENYLYHFKKTRKQRANLFIKMGLASLIYIVVLYLVEHYLDIKVTTDTHNIIVLGFVVVALIMFYIAWWHIKNPATYEVYITTDEFSISYPESEFWSFKVNIEDIEKIEQRQTHSSGGRSIIKTGLVMKNGEFHNISMNYGNSINKMFKVLKSLNPKLSFPKKVNTDYRI